MSNDKPGRIYPSSGWMSGRTVARERFLSVYGAAIAVQWAQHLREGRGLDDKTIRRFIEEAQALAEWTEEVQR